MWYLATEDNLIKPYRECGYLKGLQVEEMENAKGKKEILIMHEMALYKYVVLGY